MIRFKVSGDGLIPMNLRWWKPTQRQWVPVLLDDHPAFWKREVDPTYQTPWARLSPRYAEWKAENYPGQPILRATGLMQDASYIYTRGDVFKVKSTRYGAYHQFGTSKMPARPWMGVPDISLKQIVPIAWGNILSRRR
jgi:phage gpG-like protein